MVNGLVSSLEASNEDLLQCIYVFPILRNPCDCESTLCLVVSQKNLIIGNEYHGMLQSNALRKHAAFQR